MALTDTVESAVEWATADDRPGRVQSLAQLAIALAKEIASPTVGEKGGAPPIAALSKELRATLEELEGLRDGNDAQGQLVAGLSTPVLHGAGSEPTDIRAARRKSGRGAGQAADAVAAVRGGRGAGGRS